MKDADSNSFCFVDEQDGNAPMRTDFVCSNRLEAARDKRPVWPCAFLQIGTVGILSAIEAVIADAGEATPTKGHVIQTHWCWRSWIRWFAAAVTIVFVTVLARQDGGGQVASRGKGGKPGADPRGSRCTADDPAPQADELARYLEKISGAKPQIIDGNPATTPKHAIWVGYQPKLKELFPGTDFDFKHPEEILIAANEHHLVIAGRDRWDPNRPTAEGRGKTIIEGWQDEYGTVNAVYTFLQDYLGVRWLWPGETGEDIVQQETITCPVRISLSSTDPVAERNVLSVCPRRWQRNLAGLDEIPEGRSGFLQSATSLDALTGAGFEDWWKRFHDASGVLRAATRRHTPLLSQPRTG